MDPEARNSRACGVRWLRMLTLTQLIEQVRTQLRVMGHHPAPVRLDGAALEREPDGLEDLERAVAPHGDRRQQPASMDQLVVKLTGRAGRGRRRAFHPADTARPRIVQRDMARQHEG
jgi:hypothetical protein